MANNKLVQEIGDEFLTCKICFEAFTDPKSLSCLHTFCEKCLEGHINSQQRYKYGDYRDMACPLCRKKTTIPTGGIRKLPDNFLIMSLHDMIGRQRPTKLPFCEICKMVHKKISEASSKCVDCSKLLCKNCVDMHNKTRVTQGHTVYDIESEKEIECKIHPDELIRFYCERCETCVCVLCTFTDHKDHEVMSFKEGVNKYKPGIEELLTNAKYKIGHFKEQLEKLSRCEATIKLAEQEIRDVTVQFCHVIRSKEQALIEELHELVGTETMDFINNKTAMRESLESLSSTCSLADLVLRGREIEFLLVKKQLMEKLSDLGHTEGIVLPESISKRVTFIQGSVSLGYLEIEEAKVKSENEKHVRFTLPGDTESAEESDSSAEPPSPIEEKGLGDRLEEPTDEFHDANDDGDDEGEEGEFTDDDMIEPLLEYKQTQTEPTVTADAGTMTSGDCGTTTEGTTPMTRDLYDKEVQTELSLCMRRRTRGGGDGGGSAAVNGQQQQQGSNQQQAMVNGISDTSSDADSSPTTQRQLNRQETL